MAASRPNQRGLVRVRQVVAGGDEERAASHRRIDDLQIQNSLGAGLVDERRERPSHEIVSERLGRVERSGRLSQDRAALQGDPSSLFHAGLVVEQRFVDGAELLDAQVAVGDAFAPGAIWRGTCGQREHRPADRQIVQVAPLGERGSSSREQPAVEGADPEIASMTPGVGHSAHCAQRVPQAGRHGRPLGRFAQRLDAVTLAVDRMPYRHERPRLGEEQEEDPVHDRERLFECP